MPKTCRIVDSLPFKQVTAIVHALNLAVPNNLDIWARRNLKAVATGEKRAPKKGELYLSGAEVEAYIAPNDLNTEYQIARVVFVEVKTVEVITEVPL